MVQSSANVIYLESVIEYTQPFPSELQRLLALIRMLDMKSEQLKRDVEAKVLRAQQQPSLHGREAHAETKALLDEIERDHALLLSWAEERVQVALNAYELVEHYLERVDKDLNAFDDELRALEQPGLEDFDDLPGFTPREAPLSGRAGKAPRIETIQSAPDFGPPVSNDLPVPELQRPPRTHRPVPKQHSMASMHAEVPEALGGDTSMAVDPPAPLPQPAFINPPPPDLRQASAHLQTKGRFLEYSDVGTQLRGRRAELYWPDDGYWYLIEIQDINAASMTAHIMYMTGDTEELQLGDIIRDKHMHLINK